MRKLLRVLLIFVLLSSCSTGVIKTITIHSEKDLIPEGIAISGNNIFISSIHKNKIIVYDIINQSATDFISSNQYGFKSGVGLFVKDTLLFALTNDLNAAQNSSSVFVFNITSRTLVKEIALKDGQSHFLNDLAISSDNQIFITDSKQHKIFKLDYANAKMEEYLSGTSIEYPNGITISDDNKILFVASAVNGLRIIDLSTKTYLNNISNATRGIDGMKYYNGSIYAIRNSDKDPKLHGLYTIKLAKDNSAIEKTEKTLAGNKLMDVPTTLDVHNGYVYLISNSQIDNLRQETNEIIDTKKLTDTYILQVKIKSGG